MVNGFKVGDVGCSGEVCKLRDLAGGNGAEGGGGVCSGVDNDNNV